MAFLRECWASGFACTSQLSSPITYFEYVIIPKLEKKLKSQKLKKKQILARKWKFIWKLANSDENRGIVEEYLQCAKAAVNPGLYPHRTLPGVKMKERFPDSQ